MKNVLILIACFAGLTVGTTMAQPASKQAQDQMKKLAYWEGEWIGEASIRRGPGEPIKVLQEEAIEFRLSGTLLLIEGIGRSPEDGSISFNALAILNFNETTNSIQMKSYLQDGKSTDAWFNVIDENKFEWGFDVPNGKIKYNIILNPEQKTWKESGAYSQDGNNWMNFMEMNLKKVK
jgi:hypothetical protein